MSDRVSDHNERGWTRPNKRSGAFRNWAIIIGFLGLVAASPIGQAGYILFLITVIGMPIAFGIMAVPSIALVTVCAFFIWRFRPHKGLRSVFVAFGVVLVALLVIPTLHNLEVRARVAQLTGNDVGAPDGAIGVNYQRGGDVGLIKRRNLCEAACVHMLMTGQASSVLVTRFSKSQWSPDFGVNAHRYQLERHVECPERQVIGGGVRVHGQHRRDKTPGTIAGDYARLLDAGYCVVITKASLADADLVVTARTSRYFAGPWTVSPVPSLIKAGRMAVYEQEENGRFVTRWQQTPTHYSLLKTPLVIVFNVGAQLRTSTEFLRTYTRDDRPHLQRGEILRRAGFQLPDRLQ
ncbi:MAG: hypothetical protein AAFR71_09545 [Pseudomonadota bacterium]